MPRRKVHIIQALTAGLIAMLAVPPALAADGWVDRVSAEVGAGSRVGLFRVGVQSDWDNRRWFEGNGRHLHGYWDVSVAYWRGTAYDNQSGQRQHIANIGFTPVLRYSADQRLGWYVEGGIGLNLLTQTYHNDGKHLSTAFQFGDHLGTGYVFPNGWDLGFKLQHFSNGGIKKPNNGVNFLVMSLSRPF